jgi:hypothetical protein
MSEVQLPTATLDQHIPLAVYMTTRVCSLGPLAQGSKDFNELIKNAITRLDRHQGDP